MACSGCRVLTGIITVLRATGTEGTTEERMKKVAERRRTW